MPAHPLRAAAGHRRAIKSTGVGGCGRIRLVVILHPAYQLMQRKPLKEMKPANFPATYQTSSWYRGRCCNRYQCSRGFADKMVPERWQFKPVQRLAPVRRGSSAPPGVTKKLSSELFSTNSRAGASAQVVLLTAALSEVTGQISARSSSLSVG